MTHYRGRFAPSPTGPLHFGSLVAAVGSYLDAKAHDGEWLLRIEDLDPPRETAGAARQIIDALARFGFSRDGDIAFQSARHAGYREAFERLQHAGLVYPCACTRKEIADSVLHPGAQAARPASYPGTCRNGLPAGKTARAWRIRVPDSIIAFDDRRLGSVSQNLAHDAGDFVLLRADGLWAYQLAVVVDDAGQGITHVVRGEDLLESTPRQIFLQQCLGYATPRYLHLPVVVNAKGEKLSKQTGAQAIDGKEPGSLMRQAFAFLGLPDHDSLTLASAAGAWRQEFSRA